MIPFLAALFQESESPTSTMFERFQKDPIGVIGELSPIFVPLLTAIATLVLGRFVAGFLRRLLTKLLAKRGVDATLTGFLGSLTYMAIMTVVVISAISKLGVETTSFVAVLGAAGLAVGFALQGSLGNFAAGILIILFRPFRAGDFVEAGGVSGVILDVQIFATTMKSADNKKIIVPNGSIMQGNIVNYSAHDTRRIDLVFGCSYEDDVRKAKKLLLEICTSDKRVLSDPAPVVGVSKLGESSVDFVVRPWVRTSDYWDVYWDLHEQVKLRFDEAGLSIPFPQRDVHLHQVA